MFTVRTKKKTLQMYLMKRSVCGCSAGSATSFRRYWQTASITLRGAGRHERVDAALAAAAPHHHRHERNQQHAGQREHRNLIGEDVMTPFGVSGPRCAGRSISGC